MLIDKTLKYKQFRGFSTIELIIVLLISSIITVNFTKSINSLKENILQKTITSEIQETLKTTISLCRLNITEGQVLLLNNKNLKQFSLLFILKDKPIFRINPSKIIKEISIKTSSVFKDHIKILPQGYVSPASITINFISGTACMISISRLGRVKLKWLK